MKEEGERERDTNQRERERRMVNKNQINAFLVNDNVCFILYQALNYLVLLDSEWFTFNVLIDFQHEAVRNQSKTKMMLLRSEVEMKFVCGFT